MLDHQTESKTTKPEAKPAAHDAEQAAELVNSPLATTSMGTPPPPPNQPGSRPNAERVLAMQRTHGNAYTQRALKQSAVLPGAISNKVTRDIQRVVVQTGGMSETLYRGGTTANGAEQPNFAPESFSSSTGYELTRAGDAAANVAVKILFRSRARSSGSDYSDSSDSEIPSSDPRRAWATNMCTQLTGLWNGKYVLHSQLIASAAAPGGAAPTTAPATPATTPATPATGAAPATAPATPAAPTELRLPITFSAEPLWAGSAGGAIHTVYLHDRAGGGQKGQPIDAGNWYTSKNAAVYGASEQSIYAHEYGHLLGLPDEYSRSNPQIHQLFHNASPTQEVAMNREFDKASLAQMALRAMMPALRRSFNAISQQVATGIAGQRPAFEAAATAGVTAAWADPALPTAMSNSINVDQFDLGTLMGEYASSAPWWSWVFTTPIGAMLIGRSRARTQIQSSLGTSITHAIANINAASLATAALGNSLAPGSIAGVLSALMAQYAAGVSTSIPMTNSAGVSAPINITVNTAASLENVETRGGDITAASNEVARGVTGEQAPAVGPGGTPLPQLAPPSSMTDQLATSMNGIDPAAMNTYLTAQMSAARMSTFIRQQITASLAAGSPFAGASVAEAEQRIRNLIDGATRQAIQSSVNGIFSAYFQGPVRTAVNTLRPTLEAEAALALSNPATVGAPSPAVVSATTQVMARMRQIQQAEQTALTAQGAEPAAGTQAAETQATVGGLMGDNNASSALRTDHMNAIRDNFNTQFRIATREDAFEVRNA